MRVAAMFNDSFCVLEIKGAILLTPPNCKGQLTLCTGSGTHWHHILENYDAEIDDVIKYMGDLNEHGFSQIKLFDFYNDEYLLNDEYTEDDM